MKKIKTVVALVAVISIVIVGIIAFSYLGKGDETRYNVVEIYVLNWDLNATEGQEGIDVQFRISIDSDGDGEFELVRSSPVLNDTTIETVPFRLGAAIDTTEPSFFFKVEVFRIIDGVQSPMFYTDDATAPVNKGYNNVDLPLAWSFDATDAPDPEGLACRISYVCYVNSV